MQNQSIELNFFSDSGHGWIGTNKALLVQLGIDNDISTYSYIDGDVVYLEEDCDASRLINKLKDNNINYSLNEIYQDGDCFIRNLKRYN